jgi:hypothetical protein
MNEVPKEQFEQRPYLEDAEEVVHPDVTPPPPGRPPYKYSKAVHEVIVEQLKRGQQAQGACARAGITVATFYRWIEAGKAGDPWLSQFAEDVEIAFNSFEADAVDVIAKNVDPKQAFASTEDAKWMLERTRSERYSKQVKTAVEGQIKEFLDRLGRALDPLTFEKVLAVYLGQSPSAEIGAKTEAAKLPANAESEEQKPSTD